MDRDDRPFDVILLGATGFTGGLTAHHLAEQVAAAQAGVPAVTAPGLRWAIAGRDLARVRRVADDIEAAHGLAARPETRTADVGDPTSLAALARQTRVLATTVGPYRRLGEAVVEACIASGTDYVDITGEPAFVARLRSLFDDAARAAGLRIVTCCGFDSVPHDLGVFGTVALLDDDVPVTVRGYLHGRGRVSGGTAASALQAIADGPRASGRIAPAPGTATTLPAPIRSVGAVAQGVHRLGDGGWAVPLPTIDPLIVRRSAEVLPGYGTAFRYGHYARIRRLPTLLAGAGAVGVAAAMARTGPTRRLLERALPAPGEGPDPATRARSRFEVRFIADAGGTRTVTRVQGGDPGYDETARWLGQAAWSLARDDDAARHPTLDPRHPAITGVVTPAIGLGAPYLERLRGLGLGVEVVDTQTAAAGLP